MEMKELQQMVKSFCIENQLESPMESKALDLVSEVGEVSKEILKMTNYGREPLRLNPNMEVELGDVLYSLINMANHFDICLETALVKVIGKYEQRMKKGGPGSEND